MFHRSLTNIYVTHCSFAPGILAQLNILICNIVTHFYCLAGKSVQYILLNIRQTSLSRHGVCICTAGQRAIGSDSARLTSVCTMCSRIIGTASLIVVVDLVGSWEYWRTVQGVYRRTCSGSIGCFSARTGGLAADLAFFSSTDRLISEESHEGL